MMNALNRPLLRRGWGPAPQHLLCVPGRTSGLIRETPVAVLTSGGARYVVAGFAGSDWVKNARRSGSAALRCGRVRERVLLDEVPIEGRPPILRNFAREVREGRSFLAVGSHPSDAELAAASPRHPVFRIRPDPAR
jgi:hypothetical protein